MSERKPTPILIADGYTRRVGWDACDDFPEFDIEYRPLRGLEHSDFSRIVYLENDPEKRKSDWFVAMTNNVSSWSFFQSFSEDISKASSVVVGLITDLLLKKREPDFELDENGVRIDPTDDEEDAKN